MRDEDLGEVGVNPPVAILVGLGQSVSGDGSPKAEVVEFRFYGIQTRFDIAQALAIGQLRERHAEELIEARETPNATISLVLSDATAELTLGQAVHELGEQISPGVHRQALST